MTPALMAVAEEASELFCCKAEMMYATLWKAKMSYGAMSRRASS
jgi:hypothetical protein